MDELITMSTQELSRLDIVTRIIERRLTQVEAAEILSLSTRQVRRLVRAYQRSGPEGLVSKKRGSPSNRRLPSALKQQAITLIAEHYSDFGPTLACEKLQECHGLSLHHETVRRWMIEAGIWTTRSEKSKRAYQPRNRRACRGELIQIDGSDHDWFEGRASRCTLLVYIDDATSELMHLEFFPSESTFAYFEATKQYLLKHGKPVAFYSDQHSIFRVSNKQAHGGDGHTQFGRALYELNIESICANTSQAKGRVERANKTLQDRLVKELRLKKISTLPAANRFLKSFTKKFNSKFAKPPLSDHDAHRKLLKREVLDDIFVWKEKRSVSNNLTLQYYKKLYMIKDSLKDRQLHQQKVDVCEHPDRSRKLLYERRSLPYSIFDKISHDMTEVVSNKCLVAVLQCVKQE